jgi:hypothetical protein
MSLTILNVIWHSSVMDQNWTRPRPRSSCDVSRPAIAFDFDETPVFASRVKPSSGDYFMIRVGRREVFVRAWCRSFRGFSVSTTSSSSRPLRAASPIRPSTSSASWSRRFSRDACVCRSGFLAKDLRRLQHPLGRALLVNDTPWSALLSPENLVRVAPWSGDLLMAKLLPVVESVAR